MAQKSEGIFSSKTSPKSSSSLLRPCELCPPKWVMARSWNLVTLNEFRQYFNLAPYKTFEEINSDPYIADQLKRLYDHPDSVEMYSVVTVEDAKDSTIIFRKKARYTSPILTGLSKKTHRKLTTNCYDINFMEGARLRSSVALPREVTKETVVNEHGQKIKLQPGDEILCNLCIGMAMCNLALMTMLKVVGRLDNLRHAPGPQGHLLAGPGGISKYMTADQSSFFAFPTTIKIQWDGNLPSGE